MKYSNVFLIKDFVDNNITESTVKVETTKLVAKFQEDIKKLDDDDFIEIMISCFIPDIYRDNGKKEKLYTKLSEVIVGEWWKRLGGEFIIPTKKSGTEDVELINGNISVVCDAKIFRLGRSQKAPNVKDFLKLASVKTWMDNLVKRYSQNGKIQKAIGGMVTYSSLHEWEGESEVYLECTNKDTPVVMLPYEILALLLKYKSKFKVRDLMQMWDYEKLFNNATKSKVKYWKVIDGFLVDLLDISEDNYYKEIQSYRESIIISVKEYEKIISKEIDDNINEIISKLNSFEKIEEVREYAKESLDSFVNKQHYDYIDRIKKFRKY